MRCAGSSLSRATHAVLTRAEADLAGSRALGFERLCLAREWALLHAMDPAPTRVVDPRRWGPPRCWSGSPSIASAGRRSAR